MASQLKMFSDAAPLSTAEAPCLKSARSGTFTDNMRLPVHRWFRYSAGFSAEWVSSVIRTWRLDSSEGLFLDPFAGSGTAPLAAASAGMTAVGFESHPFVHRIARAKAVRCRETSVLRQLSQGLLAEARRSASSYPESAALLMQKCYEPEVLARLESLRQAFTSLRDKDTPEWELIWLAITSILRSCSGVGTAQWQYVLPNKKKVRVAEPYQAFVAKIEEMVLDIELAKSFDWQVPTLLRTDARDPEYNGPQIDLVITSPPYPNNYDYADATRLEMTFWKEVSGWSDLQQVVRRHLIRSCSQHSAADRLSLDELTLRPELEPIRDELVPVCRQLELIRQTKGGRKQYHTMVAAYFSDLARSWIALRKICKPSARICFVIGDSAPYGVYVPVDEWLSRLALAAGFSTCDFEKIRDRNIKWKNRKHRVPLKEGRLWVQ